MKIPKTLKSIIKDISDEVEDSLDKEALKEYKKTKQSINVIKDAFQSAYGEDSDIIRKKSAKEIIKNIDIEKGVNTFINKTSKNMGVKTTDDYLKMFKDKKIGLVKTKSYSIATIITLAMEKPIDLGENYGLHLICDSEDNVKFKSEMRFTFTDRDIINLCDADGNKVGYVKQWLLAIGIPVFEQKVKMCSVYLGQEKVCDIKKYEFFGELDFETTEGSLHIHINKNQTLSIKYKGKNIAKLYAVPYNFGDGYKEKYIIEYINEEYETLAILAMLAFETFDVNLDIYQMKNM